MLDKVQLVEERYEELNRLMADPAVAVDHVQIAAYAQEHHHSLHAETVKSQVSIPVKALLILAVMITLRSLAANDPEYHGLYRGSAEERDAAYHQGAAWTWLAGPLAAAHLRVHGDREQARALLQPFAHHLADYGIGSIGEITEGDPPHRPRGTIAQAWSVAEVLHAWWLTEPEPGS